MGSVWSWTNNELPSKVNSNNKLVLDNTLLVLAKHEFKNKRETTFFFFFFFFELKTGKINPLYISNKNTSLVKIKFPFGIINFVNLFCYSVYFATIHESHYTFSYFLWVSLYYFN